MDLHLEDIQFESRQIPFFDLDADGNGRDIDHDIAVILGHLGDSMIGLDFEIRWYCSSEVAFNPAIKVTGIGLMLAQKRFHVFDRNLLDGSANRIPDRFRR